MGGVILNEDEFLSEMQTVVKQYDAFDKHRDSSITTSREILKLAKQAIYAMHRNELSEAQQLIQKGVTEAKAFTLKDQQQIGAVRAALEELTEALILHRYLQNEELLLHTTLPVTIDIETYLAALSDFSGELIRKALQLATNKDVDAVKKLQDTIELLHGQFIKFDFRSGELRKKSDTLKYNLTKLDQIMYERS